MIPNCENPVWEQTFKFNVNSDLSEFQISIWATNKQPRANDMMLGRVSVLASGYKDGTEKDFSYRLKDEALNFKKDKKVRGEIQICWKYADYKRKVQPEMTTEESQKIYRHRTIRMEKVNPAETSTEKVDQSSSSIEIQDTKKIEDVYELGEELGSGAFSIVKEGTNKKTGVKAAVKIMGNYRNLEDAEEELESFNRETGILFSLAHPNIVRLYDVFEDAEHAYVVMELVEGGELFDQIVEKSFYEEVECRDLMKGVLDALVYLHHRNIVHRDLKPENLLFPTLSHDTLKLVDFGEAKPCQGNNLTDYVGTPDYMAPEILKGLPYGTCVDMWSFGVITYVMLCGFPPFDGENEATILCNIMALQYDFPSPDWDEVSQTAKDLISGCLAPQEKRLTAKEAMAHPWFAAASKKSKK